MFSDDTKTTPVINCVGHSPEAAPLFRWYGEILHWRAKVCIYLLVDSNLYRNLVLALFSVITSLLANRYSIRESFPEVTVQCIFGYVNHSVSYFAVYFHHIFFAIDRQ